MKTHSLLFVNLAYNKPNQTNQPTNQPTENLFGDDMGMGTVAQGQLTAYSFNTICAKDYQKRLLHCMCFKKRPTFTTCYNFYIHSSIATIFGINVVEKVGNQNVFYFPTSPN